MHSNNSRRRRVASKNSRRRYRQDANGEVRPGAVAIRGIDGDSDDERSSQGNSSSTYNDDEAVLPSLDRGEDGHGIIGNPSQDERQESPIILTAELVDEEAEAELRRRLEAQARRVEQLERERDESERDRQLELERQHVELEMARLRERERALALESELRQMRISARGGGEQLQTGQHSQLRVVNAAAGAPDDLEEREEEDPSPSLPNSLGLRGERALTQQAVCVEALVVEPCMQTDDGRAGETLNDGGIFRQGEDQAQQQSLKDNDDTTIIDAFFLVQGSPSSWLHNLIGRPQLLADMNYLYDFINKFDCTDRHTSGVLTSPGLEDFLTTNYNIYLSDGGIAMDQVKRTFQQSCRGVRVFVWCATGVDEFCANHKPEKLSEDVFRQVDTPEIEVVLMCMEYGAQRMAKAISRGDTKVKRVVWLSMDPFGKGVVDLFTKLLFQFCSILLPGKKTFSECFEILKAKARLFDDSCDSGFYLTSLNEEASNVSQNASSPIPAVQRSKASKPHVVKLRSSSCRTVGMFRQRQLRNMKVNAADLNLMAPTETRNLVDRISKGTARCNNHRFVFITPKNISAADSTSSLRPRPKDCNRARALALYTCNEVASSLFCQCDPDATATVEQRNIEGFQDGVFRVSCEEEKRLAEKELAENSRSALMWLDFEKAVMPSLFQDAYAIVDWIDSFGEEIVITAILTSSAQHLGHLERMCEDMEYMEAGDVSLEVDHWQLESSTIGVQIPVDALVGTLVILPLNSGKERSLLDEFQNPNIVITALEEAIFGRQATKFSSLISLYCDTDGSLILAVLIRSVEFLVILRDRCLSGEAAKRFVDALPNLSTEIRFDPNSVVSLYESMMLQLETLTDHQQEQLAVCKMASKNVHIRAKAGTGKTFIALNCVLDYLENTRNSSVLFVCCNAPLAFHFCKWLTHRFQQVRQREKALNRIFLLTASVGPAVHGVECDNESGMLREVKVLNGEMLAFGLIIVDEAHDVFRCDHKEGDREAVSQMISQLLQQNQSAKLMLLSDPSQASVPEESIEYPSTPREWSMVKLEEVCRSSIRVVLGAKTFQLGNDVEIRCAHTSDGLPLKTILFAPLQDGSDIYKVYSIKICDAIKETAEMFPNLDLHHRLAIIVPNKFFLDALCREDRPLLEWLKKSSYVPVTAANAARALTTRKKTPWSHIILDTVDEMDGLESLIVFGVGLDQSINFATARPRVACSRIYRAITRAQMLFYLINKEVQSGWLEWIGNLELDKSSTEPIYLDQESSKMSNFAAVDLVEKNERLSNHGSGVETLSSTEEKDEASNLQAATETLKNLTVQNRRINDETQQGGTSVEAGRSEKEAAVLSSGGDASKRPNKVWDTAANDRATSSVQCPYFDPFVNEVSEVGYARTGDGGSEESGETIERLLHRACETGLEDAVREIHTKDLDGRALLHWASIKGHKDIVHELLNRGADIHARDKHGSTPLHWASSHGHKDVVCELLNRGADVRARANNGSTPLHHACWLGHRGIVSHLLDYRADINAKNNDGYTPLHLTCLNGHKDVVRELLDRGADLHAKDNHGETSLHKASGNGRKGVVIELLNHGADVNAIDSQGSTSLHRATLQGHKTIVHKLLDQRANVQAKDNGGDTPLHLASLQGHKDIAYELLERGADVHAKDEAGLTPLHLASSKGHRDVVHDLLDLGAEIHAKDDNVGDTPLHKASHYGYKDVVCELLDHGSDVDAKNNHGRSPLHSACQYGHTSIVCELLDRGADAHARDSSYGHTPLHYASRNDHKDIVCVLLDRGADLHAEDVATQEFCVSVVDNRSARSWK